MTVDGVDGQGLPSGLTDIWFDAQKAPRCLALSVRLPMLVPLDQPIEIDVDTARLVRSPHRDIPADRAWFDIPTPIRLYWTAAQVDMPCTTTPTDHLGFLIGSLAPSSVTMSPRYRHVSVVTAFVPVVTPNPLDEKLRRRDVLGPLDVVVWAIADQIRATRLSGHVLRDITVEALPEQSIPYTYADVAEGKLTWTGQWKTFRHEGPRGDAVGYHEAPLPKADQDEIRRRFADLRFGTTSTVMTDLLMRAHIALDAGQPETAILGYAIACESWITNLALSLKWENAEIEATAATKLDLINSGPHTLLRKCDELGGGSWDNDKEGRIHAWLRDVAGERNRIVHRGERATMCQADRARESAGQLIELFKKRIVSSPKFPRTRTLFVGQRSIDEYGSKKRKEQLRVAISDHVANLVNEEEFRTWRDNVLDLTYRRAERPI